MQNGEASLEQAALHHVGGNSGDLWHGSQGEAVVLWVSA